MSSKHNHITRDIKPLGQCPSCDEYHMRHEDGHSVNEEQLDKDIESGKIKPAYVPRRYPTIDPKISVFRAKEADNCVHWVDCGHKTKQVVQWLDNDMMDYYCSKCLPKLIKDLK